MNNFVLNFIYAFKIFIVLNYKTINSKIYPMWALSINGPKLPKFSFFETFYIPIRHLVCHSHTLGFMYISTYVVVVRILGQKKMLIFFLIVKFNLVHEITQYQTNLLLTTHA
jgi:hypothetical protein